MIYDFAPVNRITFSASSRMVTSSGLPVGAGPEKIVRGIHQQQKCLDQIIRIAKRPALAAAAIHDDRVRPEEPER